MTMTDTLVVMEYTTTPRFRQIERHTAVAREDGSLVAVTGPAGDAESERYARLFVAAPDLLAALETLMDSQRGLNVAQWKAATEQARAAIAKARSGEQGL